MDIISKLLVIISWSKPKFIIPLKLLRQKIKTAATKYKNVSLG